MCGIFCAFLLGQENRRRKSRSTSVNWFSSGFRPESRVSGRLEKGSAQCALLRVHFSPKMTFLITQTGNDVVLSIFAFSSPLEREQKTLSLIFEDSCPLVAVFIILLGNLLLSPRSVTETRHTKSPEKRKTAVKCLEKSHFFVFFNYHKNCIIQIKSLGFFP